jgi:hypothetical protein
MHYDSMCLLRIRHEEADSPCDAAAAASIRAAIQTFSREMST